MATIWNSLHFFTNQSQHTLTDHLQTRLSALGYTLYDPFTTLTNTVYQTTVRLFVGAPQEGWVRVVGEFGDDLSPAVSWDSLCLHLHLSDVARVRVFVDATEQPLSALADCIRPPYTPDDLQRALTTSAPAPIAQETDAIPMHLLPSDVQTMAQKVNPKQVNRMFQRMMGQVAKVMGANANAAQALLTATKIDWSQGEASKLFAFMRCLTIPQDWDTPDFISLRDAYQLHLRFQRNPNAPRYPGDEEAVKAVPNALSYLPVYGGK